MALLTIGKAEARPMPRAGGSSEVTFVARSTPGQSFLRAHFAIRSAFPYDIRLRLIRRHRRASGAGGARSK